MCVCVWVLVITLVSMLITQALYKTTFVLQALIRPPPPRKIVIYFFSFPAFSFRLSLALFPRISRETDMRRRRRDGRSKAREEKQKESEGMIKVGSFFKGNPYHILLPPQRLAVLYLFPLCICLPVYLFIYLIHLRSA